MAMNNEQILIYVYADWQNLDGIQPLGKLFSQRIKGKEIFSFEYDEHWLGSHFSLSLDPNLGLFKGKQFLPEGKPNFGIFLDSSPDRWGRLLMRRREAVMARMENRKENTLFETDYLLGVFDEHRMGGIRFRLDEEGTFLNDQKDFAAPHWTSLRELEFASLHLEKEDAIESKQYLKWLNMLIAPGSSLGGARPKAGVLGENGGLWIAKFPSKFDSKDSGAWEMVLNRLAEDCGINVPEAKLLQLSGKQHTFLSKRFDRTDNGNRIHFASAMTMLGHADGEDYQDGISYLEMVEFLSRHSHTSNQDLEQLWRRILFNVFVSNTDDHLRNHGFLLEANGWTLSPAYDMNPDENGSGLKLNISENDNALDPDLVMSVAPYFKLNEEKALHILTEVSSSVENWRSVAKQAGISSQETERMKNAFRFS